MSEQPQKHRLSGPGDTWYVGEGGRPVPLPPLPDGTIPHEPVRIPPDPARDARVAARRAADARRAGRALDRWVAETYEGRRYGAAVEREGRRLVADYLDALGRYAPSELHHNRHYGVPVVGHDRVTGVPLCEHGDDADACQLAHRRADPSDLADDDGDPDRDTGAGLRLMRERGLLP